MINKIDFKMLTLALGAISLGLLTMMGVTQNYVHFADPLNEMAVAFLGFFGGIMFMLGVKK
tara:strand:+ start:191 stop:373 length:183 start_codon:yes stop_codon:yes gene_type:complete